MAVVPLDRDSAPRNCDNGAEISDDLVPAHAVTDFELPGLFAGHKIRPYIDRARAEGGLSVSQSGGDQAWSWPSGALVTVA
jgi:hypothetical protein